MKKESEEIQKEPYYMYLTTPLVERTEDMLHELKRRLPSAKRRQLNRSKFFELLLEAITDDFEKNRKDSNIQSIISFWSNQDN